MSDCITTENLTKDFGRVHAVSGISLHVREGEIYGFLGLNGAGKTTTIRMLLGMIRPSGGQASLFGQRVGRRSHAMWNRVGYMVETPSAYPDLTVRENLEIVRRLRRLPDRQSVDRIMGALRIARYSERRARHLSLGNAQRLGLAKALIHDPRLLLLDEPANGLDPAGIVEIRELLTELSKSHGVTIFISSHILAELSRLVDRVGVIHEGALVEEIEASELDLRRRRRLLVGTRDNHRARSLLQAHRYAVSEEQEVLVIEQEKALEAPDRVASILAQADCPPLLLTVEEEDLESYFLRTIGHPGGQP